MSGSGYGEPGLIEMSSDYLRGGLLASCKLPELLIPKGFIDALKTLENVAWSMAAWIQSVMPLSSNTLHHREPGVTPIESSSRVLCLPAAV